MHLGTIIFQPFSSDNTFQSERQNAVGLLEEAASSLETSGDTKRAAAVFRSLAIRGFQSPSPLSKASSTRNTRTEAFLQAVRPVLFLLVPETQYAGLEDALRALVQSAITLWNLVQSDEFLVIRASLDLDPSLQMEWHSSDFGAGYEGDSTVIPSKTQLRILTLFPKIIAKYSVLAEQSNKVPGGFDDFKSVIQSQICIHSGVGLSVHSPLVLRGEEEQHEMEEELKDEELRMDLEARRKALDDRSKMKMQRHGSISSSSSPTAGWNMAGGQKKVPEE